MLKFSSFFLAMALSLNIFAQSPSTVWMLDKMHSYINFKISHMMISKVNGRFADFDVWLSSDKENFSDAVVSSEIKVSSITTGVEMRDKHLTGKDFLDAEKFPKITFSNVVLKKKKKNLYTATGDLNIKGVSKPVTFDVVATGSYTNQQGAKVIGFTANTKITRKNFGLVFSGMGESAIGDEITIEAEFEFIKK